MSASDPSRTCARCGASFVCGLEAGHAACWCAVDFPATLPVPDENTGCLCPACLRAAIAMQTTQRARDGPEGR
ncbi:MAG TPA: cysteine-rich CWC family protein [Pelomicrobium sp.]|nr:cysteine-rich CWC family protein [Pelomicrobium sp.]